jgi:hypothetical protein
MATSSLICFENLNTFFELLAPALDLGLREILVAIVHSLELAAVDGNAGFR